MLAVSLDGLVSVACCGRLWIVVVLGIIIVIGVIPIITTVTAIAPPFATITTTSTSSPSSSLIDKRKIIPISLTQQITNLSTILRIAFLAFAKSFQPTPIYQSSF